MYGASSSKAASKTLTMLGWFSALAARASATNRAARPESLPSRRCRTFSATFRSARIPGAEHLADAAPAQGGEDTIRTELISS
jgi:hypothetical protein